MGLKEIGIAVCVVGTILAILFVPTTVQWGYRFIFDGDCHTFRGETYCMWPYEYIDTVTLLLELILINGIGLALYYFGMEQEGK